MIQVSPTGPSDTLLNALAETLPAGAEFRYYHVSTSPTKCPPLFSAPPGGRPERTYYESHFLAVSIHASNSTSTQKGGEVLVLAIEILVYTTKSLTTVFVSKADSTGFMSLFGLPGSTASPLRTITTTFISWMVRYRQRPDVKLVISLFARASDQYLFPGSAENPSKHVSTDRQLIKWWCRVLDPVLRTAEPEQSDPAPDRTTSQAYIIVPGEDSVTSFLPNDVRTNPDLRKRWRVGHPLQDISSFPTAPPRCLIPHFPDDPKARFVDELDDELQDTKESRNFQSPSKRGNGRWKSVKSLEQFWEMMAFRQECSAGRLVGFIWIVFTPECVNQAGQPESQSTTITRSTSSSPVSTLGDYPRIAPPTTGLAVVAAPSKPPHRKKLTGPITSRVPRIKDSSFDIVTASHDDDSRYYHWPADSRAELLLNEKEYKKTTELLLRLDFVGLDLAAKSSRTWIDEVGVLAGIDGSWGQRVVGRASGASTADASKGAAAAAPSNGPTILTVKKKRKAEDEHSEMGARTVTEQSTVPGSAATANSICAINVLNASLVRKKAKEASLPEAEAEAG